MQHTNIDMSKFNQPHWTGADKDKAQQVLEFIQLIMNDHDFDLIQQRYASSMYLQHNPAMTDGINGLTTYLRKLVGRFPEFSYDVKRVIVDGDLVVVHSHATVRKRHRGNERKGFNIIDTWRLSDGKLVEHWDAVQPLDGLMRFHYWLTGGTQKNQNGLFH